MPLYYLHDNTHVVSALLNLQYLNIANPSSRLASFSDERRESRALPGISWHVHCCCGQSAFEANTLTVDSRVASINF